MPCDACVPTLDPQYPQKSWTVSLSICSPRVPLGNGDRERRMSETHTQVSLVVKEPCHKQGGKMKTDTLNCSLTSIQVLSYFYTWTHIHEHVHSHILYKHIHTEKLS